MPEFVPAGVVIHTGQPIAVTGLPAVEYERAPTGISPPTSGTLAVVGAPAKD